MLKEKEISTLIVLIDLPDKVVIAFVSAEQYNGNYTLNPFLSHHYDVSSLSLLVDDISIPH